MALTLWTICIKSVSVSVCLCLSVKMHLLRLPHTAPLSQMRPLNSRSQRSFLGASIPMTRWIDSLPFLRMGILLAPHLTMAATSSTMQIWRLDPDTPRLTSPFSFTFAPPTCLARQHHAQSRSSAKDDSNAKPPDTSGGRNDVDERDVAYQDHVGVFFPTSSTVTNESLARLLFPLH